MFTIIVNYDATFYELAIKLKNEKYINA